MYRDHRITLESGLSLEEHNSQISSSTLLLDYVSSSNSSVAQVGDELPPTLKSKIRVPDHLSEKEKQAKLGVTITGTDKHFIGPVDFDGCCDLLKAQGGGHPL